MPLDWFEIPTELLKWEYKNQDVHSVLNSKAYNFNLFDKLMTIFNVHYNVWTFTLRHHRFKSCAISLTFIVIWGMILLDLDFHS